MITGLKALAVLAAIFAWHAWSPGAPGSVGAGIQSGPVVVNGIAGRTYTTSVYVQNTGSGTETMRLAGPGFTRPGNPVSVPSGGSATIPLAVHIPAGMSGVHKFMVTTGESTGVVRGAVNFGAAAATYLIIKAGPGS